MKSVNLEFLQAPLVFAKRRDERVASLRLDKHREEHCQSWVQLVGVLVVWRNPWWFGIPQNGVFYYMFYSNHGDPNHVGEFRMDFFFEHTDF